jgi:hypothetical protein
MIRQIGGLRPSGEVHYPAKSKERQAMPAWDAVDFDENPRWRLIAASLLLGLIW